MSTITATDFFSVLAKIETRIGKSGKEFDRFSELISTAKKLISTATNGSPDLSEIVMEWNRLNASVFVSEDPVGINDLILKHFSDALATWVADRQLNQEGKRDVATDEFLSKASHLL